MKIPKFQCPKCKAQIVKLHGAPHPWDDFECECGFEGRYQSLDFLGWMTQSPISADEVIRQVQLRVHRLKQQLGDLKSEDITVFLGDDELNAVLVSDLLSHNWSSMERFILGYKLVSVKEKSLISVGI